LGEVGDVGLTAEVHRLRTYWKLRETLYKQHAKLEAELLCTEESYLITAHYLTHARGPSHIGEQIFKFPTEELKHHPLLNPALPLLPQIAFPQSQLAKDLMTGPITLMTSKGRSGSCIKTKKVNDHAMHIASHVGRLVTILTGSATSLASGVPTVDVATL
jgi:hypothetical protein